MLVEDPEQPFLDLPLDSPLTQLSGAAVRYVIAVGPLAGRATMRLQDPTAHDDTPQPSKPFTIARDGFSLNCAVGCEAHERAKLERVCRYMARPPIAEERLSLDGDGLVVLELKRAFRDGTTHVLFEPEDFIARLAAVVPRPRPICCATTACSPPRLWLLLRSSACIPAVERPPPSSHRPATP